MAKTIEDLFFHLVTVFDFLVVVLIFLFFAKLKNKKIFWLVIGHCTLNSTCNFLQTNVVQENYMYMVLVSFTFIEYMILAYFFASIIKNKNFRILILIFSIVFTIVVALNYNAGKKQSIDAVPIGIETILVLVYSFYYLYEQTNILDGSLIYNRFHFWIVLGAMVYLGGSFFIYIFFNQAEGHIMDDFWFLTYLFYIVKNIFFIIAILQDTKRSSTTPFKGLSPNLN